MPRKTTASNAGTGGGTGATAIPTTPTGIDPNAVYTLDEAARAVRLPRKTMTSAIKAGQLRVSLRGKSYRVIGAWLLEWIREGEHLHYRDRAERRKSHGPPTVRNGSVSRPAGDSE